MHWTIIADVIVEIFRVLGAVVMSSGPWPAVDVVDGGGGGGLPLLLFQFERTPRESAADFVRCGPHHVRVMAHFEEVVLWRAVREVVFFQKPRLDGKHPTQISAHVPRY